MDEDPKQSACRSACPKMSQSARQFHPSASIKWNLAQGRIINTATDEPAWILERDFKRGRGDPINALFL